MASSAGAGASSSSGGGYVDVTSHLTRCASAHLTHMEPLLSVPGFDIESSMGALELMDPKLDGCECTPYGRRGPRIAPASLSDGEEDVEGDQERVGGDADGGDDTTESPVADGEGSLCPKLPWDDLTLRQARTIVVGILGRLESYLSGASLAESVYTCLYCHNGVLEDMHRRLLSAEGGGDDGVASAETRAARRSVYAASLALVRLADTIRTVVSHADIYEEEDFAMGAHGFDFCPSLDGEDLRAAFQGAFRDLDDVSNIAKGGGGEDLRAIRFMLDFQQGFLDACRSLAKLSKETVRAAAEQTKGMANKACRDLDELSSMLRSEVKGECLASDKATRDTLRRSFDPYVNRRMLGNAPVRKVRFRPPSESVDALRSLTSELGWAVCDLLLVGGTYGRIERMLRRISVSNVNILARSFLVLNLYFDDLLLGQHELGLLISSHMFRMGGVPRSLTLDARYGAPFVHRLGKPLYDTLKVHCLNRNRQRAYLDGIMLKEWATLQREASAVDYCFREEHGFGPQSTPAYVTNYVLIVAVGLMEHYLGLGIELGLFPTANDLSVAFWYRDFLLSAQMNVRSAAREARGRLQMIEIQLKKEEEERERARAAAESRSGGGKGKKNRKKKGGSAAASPTPALPPATPEDVEDELDDVVLGLRRTLCRGTVRSLAAIRQSGRIGPPASFPFTSHRRRFDKRFEPFCIFEQPPPLSFDDYVKGSDFSAVRPEDLVASATECFRAGKAAADRARSRLGDAGRKEFLPAQKDEVMAFARVCVGNLLVLHRLGQQQAERKKSGGDSDLNGKVNGTVAPDKVSFDFGAHKQYCTIKID